MSTVASIRTDFYQVPLPVVLTDSTHGAIPHFELVTVRVQDSDGATGLGYTYAVNSGAEAFAVLVDRYLTPVVTGSDVDRTEQIWQRMWWALHYVGRGGRGLRDLGGRHRALGSPRPARGLPLWSYFGGYDPRSRSTPAGSTSCSRSMGCSSRPTTTSPRASARSR